MTGTALGAVVAIGGVDLIGSPWATTLFDLVSLADTNLLIAAPFMARPPLEAIAGIVTSKHPRPRALLAANFSVSNLASGSLDVAALYDFVRTVPAATVFHVRSLHAKVYVADTKCAIVTSGNLTDGGLRRNQEYGVRFRSREIVASVRRDVEGITALGCEVPETALARLASISEELCRQEQSTDKTLAREARRILSEQGTAAELEVLHLRAHGKTTHGILCDTITYLLDRHGPLTTVELHPLVQQIHPDLCDDSVDTVIGGVHFGKKWKHYVRMAQVGLRRRGVIRLINARWSLANPSSR